MTTPHILITGGSRGIGLSIAHLFASHSYRCTLLSRNPSSLKTAIFSLPSPPNSSSSSSSSIHQSIPGDISDPQFWTTSGAFGTSYNGGKIDVLVNCAGVTQSSLLVKTEPEQIQAIIDTNLTGMMIGTRYLLRRGYIKAGKNKEEREKQESPVIINVGSLLGVKGGMGAVAYAASKAGVIGIQHTSAVSHGDRANKTTRRIHARIIRRAQRTGHTRKRCFTRLH
jgi:NAD(P)-dependent dehydrogenase (short-subunit alcohol dehydrogenase family)